MLLIEFNHVLFLLHQSIFHSSVLQVVQDSTVLPALIGSQILLTDMVEFSHVLFLLYQSIFHSSVLQVVQDSTVLPAYRMTNITAIVEFNHLCSSYI